MNSVLCIVPTLFFMRINMNNFIKSPLACLFLLLNTQFIASQSSKGITKKFGYAEIATEYIPSLGLTAPQTESTDKVNFDTTVDLSTYEKYVTTFDLLNKSTSASTLQHDLSPISTLMDNLNVFGYKSQDAGQRKRSLLNKIAHDGNAITLSGEATIGYLLAHPIADIKELQERQNALKHLVQNTGLLSSFEAALNQFKQQESEFLGCYKTPSKTEQDYIKHLFFQNSLLTRLNSNENILEFSSLLSDAMVAGPLTGFSLIGAASGYFAQQFIIKNNPNNPNAIRTMLGNDPQSFGTYFKKAVISELNGYNPKTYTNLYNQGIVSLPADIPDTELKTVKYACIGSLVALGFVALYKAYWTSTILKKKIDIHKIDAYIQRKLISCATMVSTFDYLMKQVQKDPALQNLVTSWQKDCTTKSKEFTKLLSMLRSNTFKGKPSFFSKIGRVRAAYTLMMATKDEFGDMVRFIGLCDAYAAVAKLYLQHQALPNQYSFVNFVDNEKPYIKAEGFWNPMLDAHKAISNNLELGSLMTNSPRAILVTGSNSGGKSTIAITGFTSVMLLAHTLTISPAQHLTLTPFDYLASSLKIQDNLLAGKSHFVAETEHAAHLVNSIKSLHPQQKAFLAIDELFEGTTSEVGEKSLHNLGLTLLNHHNLLFVIATQYQGQPTLLEEQTNGACKNMKVDIIKQEKNGVPFLFRPYKLEPGVSEVSVGAELLQEAYNA